MYSFIENVASGKTTELSKLVWDSLSCLAVFHSGVPSPDAPPRLPYTDEKIREAESDLVRIRTMLPADADAEARKFYDQLRAEYQEYIRRRTSESERLHKMYREVQGWKVPEVELCQDVRRVLLEQLLEGINVIEDRIKSAKRWCTELQCPGGEEYRASKADGLARHLDAMRKSNRERLEEHTSVAVGLKALEQSLGPRK